MNSKDSTTRATFVMSKSNRDLIKGIAYRYKVTQSEIMNTAPYLFLILAEQSLSERRRKLNDAKMISEEAIRSLGNLPDYFVTGDARGRITEALALEEQSLNQKQVNGPTEEDIFELMGRGFTPWGNPFQDTIIAALKEVGMNAVAERYEKENESDGDNDDTFMDEEEETQFKELVDKIVTSHLANEDRKETEGTPRSGPLIAKWNITMKDKEFSADTGADALETIIKYLVSENPLNLGKLQNVKGSTRRLVAKNRDELYPGRPDLGEHSREFMPGWFLSTNYSHIDVMRLVRKAIEEVGLIWGVDAYVKTTPVNTR